MIYVYIFNVVINKYSIFFRKMSSYKICVYYSQVNKGTRGTREAKITVTCLINFGDQKFDHRCPQVLSFYGLGWAFDISLVMQSKSRT